jgi:SPP1 gp7 family putative phage head morphogenesis protein
MPQNAPNYVILILSIKMGFFQNISQQISEYFAVGKGAEVLREYNNPFANRIVEYAEKQHRASLFEQLEQQTVTRNAQQLADWQSALKIAENKLRPRRAKLLQTYKRITLDEHLTAVIEQRKMAVIAKDFYVVKSDSQEKNDELTKVLQAPWFYKLISQGLDSIFYGHSLVEITIKNANGATKLTTVLIPREHVIPEMKEILLRPQDPNGISFIDSGYYLIEFGEPDALGLLNKAAPLCIYKGNAVGAWADFITKFGQPIRVGKVNSRQQADMDKMEDFLLKMQKSPYAVIDIADQIEIKESAHSDAFKVFHEFATRLDKGLSKLILGQTMTTDDGSSNSQAQVHEAVSNTYTLSDCRFIAQTINEAVLPLLTAMGINFDGHEFAFDLPMEISEQEFQQDQWLNENFEIPFEHFSKKYRTPINGKVQRVLEPVNNNTPPKQDGNHADSADVITLHEMHELLTTQYSDTCPDCGGSHLHTLADGATLPEADSLYKPFMRLVKRIFNTKKSTLYIGRNFFNEQVKLFTKAIVKGYGMSFENIDYTTPDGDMLKHLKENVQYFSLAKTHVELKQLTDLLLDPNGKLREWQTFKTEALKLHTLYNRAYLKTEYELAVSSAQMAAQWLRIQADKETHPFLKYVTIGDERVRQDHRRLDRITRKTDDAFWLKYYPPNGFNCRCDVAQVTKATETDLSKFTPPKSVTPMFQNNVGIDKTLFPTSHPYYAASMEAKGDMDKMLKK